MELTLMKLLKGPEVNTKSNLNKEKGNPLSKRRA